MQETNDLPWNKLSTKQQNKIVIEICALVALLVIGTLLLI